MEEQKFYDKIVYVISFDQGWNNEGEYWPDPCAVMLSQGRILSENDFVFYNSPNKIHREIRGGGIEVPCSKNHSIIGPICGDDDGDIEGRVLRATGLHDFLFFLIDLSKVESNIDEIQLLLFDYERWKEMEKNKGMFDWSKNNKNQDPRHYIIYITPLFPTHSIKSIEDFYISLIEGAKYYLGSNKMSFYSSPNFFIDIMEYSGSLKRVNQKFWKYEPVWNKIASIEEYIESHMSDDNKSGEQKNS